MRRWSTLFYRRLASACWHSSNPFLLIYMSYATWITTVAKYSCNFLQFLIIYDHCLYHSALNAKTDNHMLGCFICYLYIYPGMSVAKWLRCWLQSTRPLSLLVRIPSGTCEYFMPGSYPVSKRNAACVTPPMPDIIQGKAFEVFFRKLNLKTSIWAVLCLFDVKANETKLCHYILQTS
jgi:hypothetical protein